MPAYTTIDGDISDYFDALMDMTKTFSADELRRYLLNDGHSEVEANAAIDAWREQGRLEPASGDAENFILTDAGRAAVEQLRDSLD